MAIDLRGYSLTRYLLSLSEEGHSCSVSNFVPTAATYVLYPMRVTYGPSAIQRRTCGGKCIYYLLS